MAERRYSEDEVAAIFRYATEEQKVQEHSLPAAEGLSLAEIQQIGREVGIGRQQIARAAAVLDQREGTSVRKFLGLPIRLGRIVELGRVVSDAEWERLVVDLDEIFDAQGEVRCKDGFRSWRNGNLRVTVEPGASGARLRLGTYHEIAHRMLRVGLGLGSVAAIGALISAVGGFAWPGTTLAVSGALVFGVGAVRLPWWRRRRLAQMDEAAKRLLGAAGEPTT